MGSHLDVERASLFRELREAGYEVESENDFLKAKEIPPKAVRIMLRYALTVTDTGLRDFIVRGLTTSEVRRVPEAAPTLLELFRRPDSNRLLRWTIGNAMTEIADERVLDQLVQIVENREYGTSRQMFAVALGQFPQPRVFSVLSAGLEDDDIAGHCVIALGNLGTSEAVPYLERMVSHPKAWVRAEANRALDRVRAVDQTKPPPRKTAK